MGFAKWAKTLDSLVAERDTQLHVLNVEIEKVSAWGKTLQGLLDERDGQMGVLNEKIEDLSAWGKRLQTLLTERDQRITNINQTVNELGYAVIKRDERIAAMSNSTSWLITRPLRGAKRLIKFLIKCCLRLARRIYQSLPLSDRIKVTHRNTLAKYFPKLLLVVGSHPTIIPASTLSEVEQDAVLEQLVSPMDIAKTIHLYVSNSPLVSIIIPIYGQIDYTLQCLFSIASNQPQAAFEVIIIDDCSPDNSVEVLTNVKSIRLIRNAENQGFIRSCNTGASVAQGEYLYFLNNDTEVTSGWLDELLRTFQEFPGTGLAGSKLIYPDGRLQEAGGIIWQDGSAWNFGHSQDPLLPIYNYAREVDYCSGASIMVPKVLFEELGGFDEQYLPAYCEDSDLALKIRDQGYRVIYQPLSTVIHYEGITSGTDTSQGIKAYQIENTKKLYDRWKNRLQAHQPAGIDVDNAKDRCAIHRVLVIDHCTPTPNQDAGSLTVFNSMLLLREMGFQVTFIPENNFLYLPDYSAALQRVGIEVLYAPYVTNIEQHLGECGSRYNLVFLFRPDVVNCHLESVRYFCSNAKVLYHTVDLHFLRMFREAELQADEVKQKAAMAMKRRELAAVCGVDASIVHSTAELELLRTKLPDAELYVFPLIMNVQGTSKTFADRKDIVFVGGYQHNPNVDAVQYFVTEVMPLLRQQLPDVRFHAVGSKAPLEIQALASKDVIIVGFVEELPPLLDKMRVSVAPLRYGAGIKGKIGSAMAVGLPVVATSLAAEGMSLTNGENILVADSAEAFTDAIVKLYQDEALWNRISQNSVIFADKAWGAEAAYQLLTGIVTDLGINTSHTNYPLSLYSERRTHPKNERTLDPIASIKCREEFEQLLQNDALQQIRAIEKQLLDSSKNETFTMDGFCVPCDKKVSFLVDIQWGGQRQENSWLPNWRERLECPLCAMINRQRLMATLIKQELDAQDNQHIYFMEQVTAIYNWASTHFKDHHIIGSEYLGYQYEGGTVINGIRHEDVENLSFSNDSLDLIVSNDVFEHVPNPARAFAECMRVLKVGGVMLASIPFHSDREKSITRATLVNGKLEHLLPPVYHGNPVSADGSLVFTDFGWDIFKEMQKVGFSNVCIEVYASAEYGHLGGGQLVFKLVK